MAERTTSHEDAAPANNGPTQEKDEWSEFVRTIPDSLACGLTKQAIMVYALARKHWKEQARVD